jgi:DNA-binding transcriptional MerR regulator
MTQMRIGELASATGLTVRTLRHYDQIGLLQPQTRTESGYRIYGEAEVRRLQQIRSLQALGFSLEQIGTMLDGNNAPLPEVIGWQLEAIDRELATLQRVRARLYAISAELQRSDAVDIDALTALMKEMTMVEQYYTEEQPDEGIRAAVGRSDRPRRAGESRRSRPDQRAGAGNRAGMVRTGAGVHRWRCRDSAIGRASVAGRG